MEVKNNEEIDIKTDNDNSKNNEENQIEQQKNLKIINYIFIGLIILSIIELVNFIIFILLKNNVNIYSNNFNRYCYDNINSQINLNMFILFINLITYFKIYLNLKKYDSNKILEIVTFFKFYITLNYIIQLLIVFLFDRKFICFYLKPINLLERYLGIHFNIFALLINIFFNTIFFITVIMIIFKTKSELIKLKEKIE